jgi:hypothetical protein
MSFLPPNHQLNDCCGYGLNGDGTNGYDCLVIPGAQQSTAPFVPVPSQICGGKSVGLVTMPCSTGKTICSKGPLNNACRYSEFRGFRLLLVSQLF